MCLTTIVIKRCRIVNILKSIEDGAPVVEILRFNLVVTKLSLNSLLVFCTLLHL